ncbi:MAG: cytochrome c oxidase subunit 3 [Rhodothermales bacterium]|jgi:cytochrome c oxidase subunit 3
MGMNAAAHIPAASPRARTRHAVPTGVLGMTIFIGTEVMFFTGLISAHVLMKAHASAGWPPPNQPRLPVEATAITTALLILSGILMIPAARCFTAKKLRAASIFLWLGIGLGAAFVIAQGVEWARLIHFGLTMTSSSFGSCFYLLIGSHAVHAIAAIIGMVYVALRLGRGTLTNSALWTAQTFWYFVVLVWPVLYYMVYLK